MGLLIALTVFAFWGGHLYYILQYVEINPANPLFYLHILLQIYFYTGLFITAHDAMHGTVSRKPLVNSIVGYASTMLYAGMWYPRMKSNHKLHHIYPGTDKDPDYHTGSQNFWVWWFKFMLKYLTVYQIIIMAVFFNVLKIWYGDLQIIVFWVIPAILSTFQLFYFGTYVPHKRPHTEAMKPHNSRTLRKNHLWAMLSCYFFGYHSEHHDSPRTPWWQLYKTKQA